MALHSQKQTFLTNLITSISQIFKHHLFNTPSNDNETRCSETYLSVLTGETENQPGTKFNIGYWTLLIPAFTTRVAFYTSYIVIK